MNTYCKRHYRSQPCDICTQEHDKFSILMNDGQYIYVPAETLELLVLEVNKRIEEGYRPLGIPNIVTHAYNHQGTDNFGQLSTSVTDYYYQFMIKNNA